MLDLLPRLRPVLDDDAQRWLAAALARARGGASAIPELFPQLPRRIGRGGLGGGRVAEGNAVADLDAWRLCDAAALCLLQREAAPDALEVELFRHGDLEERVMVLRCLSLLPVRPATATLLGEIQRTNMVVHFAAGMCDSNLAVRARGAAGFTGDDFNRMLLKLAFLDLPVERVLGWETAAGAELSRMLQGLATEREAAGRPVWADTNRVIARGPTAGTLARLLGGLEHGDDRSRLAAAEGLLHLRRPEAAPLLRERLEREQRAEIRTALQRALRPE